MNSLSELKDCFINNQISIQEFGGWYLKVEKDVWTLLDGVFYLNGKVQNLKEKGFIQNYKQVHNVRNQSNQTRKWRGISSRNYK